MTSLVMRQRAARNLRIVMKKSPGDFAGLCVETAPHVRPGPPSKSTTLPRTGYRERAAQRDQRRENEVAVKALRCNISQVAGIYFPNVLFSRMSGSGESYALEKRRFMFVRGNRHVDLNKRSKDEQKEYWDWRHKHEDYLSVLGLKR